MTTLLKHSHDIIVILILLFVAVNGFASSTRIPNFTSATYRAVYEGDKPSSYLPYWHGYQLQERLVDDVQPQLTFWTEHLYNEVSHAHNLLTVDPKGIRHFCPNYVNLDREKRILFWTRLISIIAAYESAYNPNSTYNEPTMPGVKSMGLLQLSNLSAMSPEYDCTMIGTYGETKLGQASENLRDPKRNLSCAVRIMDYWIGHDEVMIGIGYDEKDQMYWKGLARYWGTFRHPSLKDEADKYWDVIDQRRPTWQRESRERDAALKIAIKEAREKDQGWGNVEWRARGLAPHPSVLDYIYEKQESHPLTAIVRIANQTGFCF